MASLHLYGDSGQIGQAVATLYKDNGYDITGFDSKSFDFTDPKALTLLGSKQQQADTVIFASGINEPANLSQITQATLNKHFSVNLFSAVMIAKSYWNHFEKNGGKLIFISSILANQYRVNRLQYRLSKAALEAMIYQLAHETTHPKFLINGVAPGIVDSSLTLKNNTTEQIEALKKTMSLGRLLTPQEIALQVFSLGSPQNTCIHGQVVTVCGGYRG